MKKLIFLSFIIFLSFFTINSQVISPLDISGQYYDIRSDNNGTIHILWLDTGPGRDGLAKYGQIVNRQVVNQVTIPVIDTNEVNYRKVRPRLSVKPDGSEVHFVWVTPLYQSKDFMHCWRNSAGTWFKEKIYTASKYNLAPTFTVDSSGVYHAAVIEDNGSNVLHPIAYFRKAPGGNWTRMTNLAPATKEYLWPNLFTDTNGNVHITWDRDKDYIQYRYAPSGGNLSTSATITLPLGFPHNKQSEVFADAAGNVYVTALSFPDGGTPGNIDFWSKPVGGGFSSPATVSGASFRLEGYFPYSAIIARSPEMIAVSWAETVYVSNPATVRASIYDGAWTVYTLSTTANFKTDSRTAMAMDNSSAYCIWREAEGIIYLATFEYLGTKTLTVISPNGGESWANGSSHNITWEASGLSNNLKITLWKDGASVGTIATDVDPTTGSYSWVVGSIIGAVAPDGAGYSIKIKEIDTSVADTSDAPFEIVTPEINVTSPNGGESWGSASTQDITWDSAGLSYKLKITLWKESILVGTIATNVDPITGSYSWVVGSFIGGIAPNGTGYTVKIKEIGTAVSDVSDAGFEIVTPQITVTSPNGGESWLNGSLEDIIWNAAGLSYKLKITLWKDGLSVGTIATNVDPADGSYMWKVGEYIGGTAVNATGYTIKIKEIGTAVSDDSDAGFTITGPQITILSPNGSEAWGQGDSQDITWNYIGVTANLKITLWNDGLFVGIIATDIDPSTGMYNWTVGNYIDGTAPTGDGYTIKIKEIGTAVSDLSDDIFSIIIRD